MVGGLEEEEKMEKLEAEYDYNHLLKMEVISWRQKSRETWLKEGDRNTKFFHNLASWRRSVNSITRLKVQGHWVYDQERIRNAVEHYYIDLYSDPLPHRPHLEDVECDVLSEEQRTDLDRPFSVEEVLEALNSIEDDKALSPNGFPTKFLKECWDVV